MDHSTFLDKKVTVYFDDPISIDSRTVVHVSGTCGAVSCGLLALNNVVDVSDGQADGLATPLTYWGGESILSLTHPDRHVLASIGTACIVEFLVPVSTLCFSLGKSLAAFTLHQGDNAHAELCDLCVQGSIAGTEVRRIIRRTNADFEAMTGCLTWGVAVT